MSILKKIKDYFIKSLLGNKVVPQGLFELSEYFRFNPPINFERTIGEDGAIIMKSTNFRFGAIVTYGKNEQELEKNIKDAILTSFEIPSSYAQEAKIRKVGEEQKEYALA